MEAVPRLEDQELSRKEPGPVGTASGILTTEAADTLRVDGAAEPHAYIGHEIVSHIPSADSSLPTCQPPFVPLGVVAELIPPV